MNAEQMRCNTKFDGGWAVFVIWVAAVFLWGYSRFITADLTDIGSALMTRGGRDASEPFAHFVFLSQSGMVVSMIASAHLALLFYCIFRPAFRLAGVIISFAIVAGVAMGMVEKAIMFQWQSGMMATFAQNAAASTRIPPSLNGIDLTTLVPDVKRAFNLDLMSYAYIAAMVYGFAMSILKRRFTKPTAPPPKPVMEA